MILWGSVFFTAGASLPALGAGIVADSTAIMREKGGITLTIGLSEPVAFQVFTLDNPRRLLVDLGETDLAAMPSGMAEDIPEVSDFRYGLFQPGESRIVLDLARPMLLETAQNGRSPEGNPLIRLHLTPATADEFAAKAAPPGRGVWRGGATEAKVEGTAGLPIIALDAGHGGLDQGARQGEAVEKDIVLQMALVLRDTLLEDGRFRVVMTRQEDVFIPLGERVEIARRAGADAFISLHADVVTLGRARGTTVFSLSEASKDQQAVTIATLENRSDLVAGISVVGEGDDLTQILLQMAYRETDAFSSRFGDVLAEALWFQNDSEIKSRRMAAGFRVLRAPDIPSVLVELGFMSDKADLENLLDPEWQQGMSETLLGGLLRWFEVEAEMRGLLRN